ncbi:glycerophosphodiester phosphodiesterase [Paenibacillus antri]|uniref:Glycerophosphodiester phosphodiesterase n=2 Tax=Paenibacillus antri TaxID=2582848 RepID=A0A5R9GCY4_9BACL|nr:glycerophosphodiester phosphodiesterase [Paenibacillus antri]
MKIRGIAHRGYPALLPENTLVSFRKACELNFSHVELDVQLSKDGVPVVFHDFTLDRLTDGSGSIRDYTLQQLKRYRVRGSEEIPTLEEAMNALKGRADVFIELKQAGDLYPGLEAAVLEVLYRTGTRDQSCVTSFDHYAVERTRTLDDRIRLGLISSGSMPYVFPFMKEIRADYLFTQFRYFSPLFYERMLEEGIVPGPWPVETQEQMEIVASLYPASLITTDHLERWAEFYRNRRQLWPT